MERYTRKLFWRKRIPPFTSLTEWHATRHYLGTSQSFSFDEDVVRILRNCCVFFVSCFEEGCSGQHDNYDTIVYNVEGATWSTQRISIATYLYIINYNCRHV